ncbi:hypothetical protein SDC9_71909 [bioreactor metagenome]|uniref:Uncharacterized protein n=1 Tax=bioreactor metagenome TaxID=1076179 RepID=A0A644YA46_9ZZZZ
MEGFGDFPDLLKGLGGFDEQHIGAGAEIQLAAAERFIQVIDGSGVCPGHDDRIPVHFFTACGLDLCGEFAG